MFVVFALLVIAAFAMPTADATNCYKCSSLTNSNCTNPVKITGHDTCGGQKCFKIYGSINDASVVVRGCTDKSYDNACFDYASSETGITGLDGLVNGQMCVCKDHLCNTAAQSVLRGHVSAVAVVAALVVGRLAA